MPLLGSVAISHYYIYAKINIELSLYAKGVEI